VDQNAKQSKTKENQRQSMTIEGQAAIHIGRLFLVS
jgi:hypothetical protein